MNKHVKILVAAAMTAAWFAASAADFQLNSPSIAAGTMIGDDYVFNGFGCAGKNVSPELRWSGAPAETKSYAVTVYDPDAPTGSGWWHWIVINIPADKTGLSAGFGNQKATAFGQQTATDFGAPGWGGPCPPAGTPRHRYVFTVYALKVPVLEVPAGATGAMVGFNINANALGHASFTAYYGR